MVYFASKLICGWSKAVLVKACEVLCHCFHPGSHSDARVQTLKGPQ